MSPRLTVGRFLVKIIIFEDMERKTKKSNKMITLMTGTLVGLAFLQLLIALLQVIIILFKLE